MSRGPGRRRGEGASRGGRPLSVTANHDLWVSLLDLDGPFLSKPVLKDFFPQGMPAGLDAETREALRIEYDEWQAALEENPGDLGAHRRWIAFVLERLLDLPADRWRRDNAVPASTIVHLPGLGETLRPERVLIEEADPGTPDRILLLVDEWPPSTPLDRPDPAARWRVSPRTKVERLLKESGRRLGLVTNGEEWCLVAVPEGRATTFATWRAEGWLDEPITASAFRELLGRARFYGVPEDKTLPALLEESARRALAVSTTLGLQVRDAIEELVRALDRADAERGRALLAGVPNERLYEAALTVMMRLVFLLYAEERDLLPAGDALWAENYGVASLHEQLRAAAERHGEEVLDRRYDAWDRLLSATRAVYGGISHDRLRIRPYGGHLFNPDRFPFLEGRTDGTDWRASPPVDPLPITNRTVLRLLGALKVLDGQAVSFRALDIEQIGHVYEVQLAYGLERADQPMVVFKGGGIGPLREIARATGDARLRLIGRHLGEKKTEKVAAALAPKAGRSKRPANEADPLAGAGRIIKESGLTEAERTVLREIAPVLEGKSVTDRSLIPPGHLYLAAGGKRAATGSHYTPNELTEPIVRHTLDPLVFENLGKPTQHLKSPEEILALKVLDPAMGSGAFLVQVVRYLGRHLADAWEARRRDRPDDAFLLKLPADRDDLEREAGRYVAMRCIYGVDKNPLAVEMARLSLWLTTLAKDKPFTFLEHALKCGDSLVGVDEDQLMAFSLDPGEAQLPIGADAIHAAMNEAAAKRLALTDAPADDMLRIKEKRDRLKESQEAVVRLIAGGHFLIDAFMTGSTAADRRARTAAYLDRYAEALRAGRFADDLFEKVREIRDRLRPFHWPFEFPEVFAGERRGFDAIVGNPPFLGGRGISENYGDAYADVLGTLHPDMARAADYCAHFFRRAHDLLRPGGNLGLIATNTIAQGDTRESGLEKIVAAGSSIYRAVSGMPWPGQANVQVSVVHIHKGVWTADRELDGASVPTISALLDAGGDDRRPERLRQNAGKSFQGSIVLGMGFVLAPAEAEALIKKNPKNRDCLFPYLNGEDLNTSPRQEASRWVINFGERSEVEAKRYPDLYKIVRDRVFPERQAKDAVKYPRMVNEWWKYWNPRVDLYRVIAPLKRVLVTSRVSEHLTMAFAPTGVVFADRLVVIALGGMSDLAILQSSFHDEWIHRPGQATLETRGTYNHKSAFETFPFPQSPSAEARAGVEAAGKAYYEHRQKVMLDRNIGLTKTYNLFHDAGVADADIRRLRDLHVEMDRAVLAAYGWTDLDLGHAFQGTGKDARFTISPAAKREILKRLLDLNLEIAAREAASSPTEKSSGRGRGTRKASAPAEAQGSLPLFETVK